MWITPGTRAGPGGRDRTLVVKSDVTLVWDDGKRVKAHKDKLCRGSADSERELIVQSSKHVQPSKPFC